MRTRKTPPHTHTHKERERERERERESRSPGEGEVVFYASKTDINHVSI